VGQSAQIERILEGFAAAFFAHNPPRLRDGSLSQAGPGAPGWYIRQPRVRQLRHHQTILRVFVSSALRHPTRAPCDMRLLDADRCCNPMS